MIEDSKCPMINGAAYRHTMRLIRGTRLIWLFALVLSLWVGLDAGFLLAQSATETWGDR